MILTDVLSLSRALFVVDVETTGLDTGEARIVELGFQRWHPEKPLLEFRTLIKPGVPIPDEVTKIHHISEFSVNACAACGKPLVEHTAMIRHTDGVDYPGSNDPEPHAFKTWPTFKQIAAKLADGFRSCDYAGKNVRFDLRVLSAEFERAGVAWNYLGARIVDADRLEQLGEPRHLGNLYKKHTGKTLEDAHQALADVRATTEVIVAQLQRYQTLPRDLNLLHKAQWPEEWLDGKGQFKMVNGVATCTFGKHKGKAMRDVPADYYQWIGRPDVNMPADVKALAAGALRGEYPS